MIEAIEQLIASSLLQTDSEESNGRFYLLPLIRDYAHNHLRVASDLPNLQFSHATYFAQFAAEGGKGLEGANQKAWLERLSADDENGRAAMRRMIAQQNANLALQLIIGWSQFWENPWLRA